MPEHKATPEQWASIRQAAQPREVEPGIFAGDTTTTLAAGLMDLRARVESLEAKVRELQSCHNKTADHLLDTMALVRGTASAEAQPAPASSLVDRLRAYSWRRPLQCPSPATIAECGGPCEQGFPFCDCGLLEQLNPELKGPAPAGSLVERVAEVFLNKQFTADDPIGARSVLRKVAAFARAKDFNGQQVFPSWAMVAQWLEQEAGGSSSQED